MKNALLKVAQEEVVNSNRKSLVRKRRDELKSYGRRRAEEEKEGFKRRRERRALSFH